MKLDEYSNPTGLPSVSQIINQFVYLAAFKEFHRIRGRVVHQAIAQTLHCGFPVIESSDHKKYFESFLQIERRVINVTLLEKRLSIPGLYTGQIDLSCLWKEPEWQTPESALLDWKTSQSASKTMPISLAGYKRLMVENGYPEPKYLINVLLNKDGKAPKVIIWPIENYVKYSLIFDSALNTHLYFGSKKLGQDNEIV